MKNPETIAVSGPVSAICLITHFGCGGRIRTCDLRVMSPTSYQLLYSASFATQCRFAHCLLHFLVLVAGLEPARMISPTDFKSVASASSATRAGRSCCALDYHSISSQSCQMPLFCDKSACVPIGLTS